MAKGKSASSGKRVKKVLKENSSSITNGSIKRLARRGGVKRISKNVYDEVRGLIRGFVDGVVRDATAFTEARKSKTVALSDVVASLRGKGRQVYGF
jgi:histone H4